MVLRAEDKRRTETSEMRFLRSVLSVSLRERMVEEIQEYQKKWHRIPPERLPWQTYSYHPVGRRDIGHARRRWRQQFL
jgi:hypothetical protein